MRIQFAAASPDTPRRSLSSSPSLPVGPSIFLLVSLLATAALAAAATTLPARPPKGITDALWARMRRIDAAAGKIKDLSADFEQKKISPLLKKPLVSSGTVRLRGSVMLWDTRRPEPTLMRVDDHSVTIYYVNQKTAEVYPIGGQLAQMASSPVPRLAELLKHFDIAPAQAADLGEKDRADTEAFVLTPTEQDLKKHVDHVTVLIDAKQALILKLALVDAEGETTEIRFSNVATNSDMDEKRVELTLPPGTRIVHPLENVAP